MRRLFRGKLGLGLGLFFAMVVFSWSHFSNRIRECAALGRHVQAQADEMIQLKAAIERMQTLKSLKVDMRLNLFGDQGRTVEVSATTAPRGILSNNILGIASKAGVRFVRMDQTHGVVDIRFLGSYPEMSRFLGTVESEFPRIERFAIEKSNRGGVLLSLTVPER